MKKLVFTLLVLCLTAILLPASAAKRKAKPGEITSGDYRYVVQEDGTAKITDYIGGKGTATIPEEIDGLAVTALGTCAFNNSDYLRSVTIPNCITSVDGNPFTNCKIFHEIIVSPDHPYLEMKAGVLFSKPDQRLICYPQTYVDDPYVIPDYTRAIGDYAFAVSHDLRSVVIPDSVESVGDYAFSQCTGLTFVRFPDSVTTMGDRVFQSCRSLGAVMLPSGLTRIGEGMFNCCDVLHAVEIPEGVTSIGNYAFLTCRTLQSVTIPDSVSEIGGNVFGNCPALREISLSPDHPYLEKTDGVLFSKPDRRLVCHPSTLQHETYTVPEETRIIGENAFSNCARLTAITIPDSVEVIRESAFVGCKNLVSINLPEGLQVIDQDLFYGCASLPSLTIPDSVTVIGKFAFHGCESLASVNIPDGVTEIGMYAFFGCGVLSSLSLPDSLESVGDKAFAQCDPSLTLTVGQGSWAEKFCEENGLPYTYR